MLDPKNLLLEQLVKECHQQTQQFKRTGKSDARCCYELFRRAFGEEDSDAYDEVYFLYKPQVEKLAWRHQLISKIDFTPDVYADIAFVRAYKYLRGSQFEQKTSNLKKVLAYIKRTLNTVILEEFRRELNRIQTIPIDELVVQPAVDPQVDDEGPSFDQIIERMRLVIKNVEDQLLFIYSYVDEMTPAEIIEAYPYGPWRDERHVSNRKYNMRQRLLKDPVFRAWAGLDDEEGVG